MDENLNLVELLKNCPEGTKLYSPIFGEVSLYQISQVFDYPISVKTQNGDIVKFNEYGIYYTDYAHAECLLFPSKCQRDWEKCRCPKPKFDPKTLNPFDEVLVRDKSNYNWSRSLFFRMNNEFEYHNVCTNGRAWKFCIPYNEDTKHLVGTTDEAPEFYRYWEE